MIKGSRLLYGTFGVVVLNLLVAGVLLASPQVWLLSLLITLDVLFLLAMIFLVPRAADRGLEPHHSWMAMLAALVFVPAVLAIAITSTLAGAVSDVIESDPALNESVTNMDMYIECVNGGTPASDCSEMYL